MKTQLIRSLLVLTVLIAGVSDASAQPAQSADTVYLTQTQVNTLFTTSSKSYPGVHDPSVVYNNNGTYYIFGSHNEIGRAHV